MIKSGELLPSMPVRRVDSNGTNLVNSLDWLGAGTTVFFAVPGAFTPTCHNYHLPGFVACAREMKALGVDRIVCATVNDAFVVTAWAKDRAALGKIEFLADFDATLATALGLARDRSSGGLGLRYQRSAFIARGGIVEKIFVDEKPGQVTNTAALPILAILRDQSALSVA